MKEPHCKPGLAIKILSSVVAFLVYPSTQGQLARFSSNGQCSLTVVSRLMAGKGKTCDSGTVLRLARGGQVYEQNQLGIASILALGPDFSVRDALDRKSTRLNSSHIPL